MQKEKSRRKIYPPVYFFITIILMVPLHYFLPIKKVVNPPISYIGLILILTAITMLVWAARSFGREKTTIKPFEQSSELVTYGLYRFTRNPMYLSMVMTLFGLAIFLGSITPFLLIPVFILLIQRNFIIHEERGLEETFGEKYKNYKALVRRWI